MFNDIGKRVMRIAEISAAIEIVAGLIFGMVLAAESEEFWYFVICLLASMIIAGANWPLYAFGQIVDDVHAMRTGTQQPNEVASDELPDL